MHCSSCANLSERASNKTPGVERASVNFAAEKALINFKESSVNNGCFVWFSVYRIC